MARQNYQRPQRELDYSSVFFNLMMSMNSWAQLSFSDRMENRAASVHKLRALVLLMKAYLSPFAKDPQYKEAIKDIRDISTSDRFTGSLRDMDKCMKHIAACVELAFKYQLVQPYQEEILDESDTFQLSHSRYDQKSS